MTTWFQIVNAAMYLSIGSMFIPLFAVMYLAVRRKLNKEILLFAWLIVFWNLINISSTALAFSGQNNNWLMHIMVPVEFIILAALLTKWGKHSLKITLLVLFLMLFVGFDQYIFSDYSKLGSVGIVIEGITLISLSVSNLIFSQLKPYQKIITISIFFYYALATTALLAMNDIQSLEPFFIYSLTNIISNLLYAWGVLCSK